MTADIIHLRPRSDAPVQPIPRAEFGLRPSDEARAMEAAREADEHAQTIARQIIGEQAEAKHAREHELRALSAKWEAVAFMIRQLARETYALAQRRAARTGFDMADLCDTVAGEVYPHDEGGAA